MAVFIPVLVSEAKQSVDAVRPAGGSRLPAYLFAGLPASRTSSWTLRRNFPGQNLLFGGVFSASLSGSFLPFLNGC